MKGKTMYTVFVNNVQVGNFHSLKAVCEAVAIYASSGGYFHKHLIDTHWDGNAFHMTTTTE
jgi:hypothetical protein